MVATNTFGRQVVVPLTNKSGGGVIAGDVVVLDAANDDAFTTTTTAGYTGVVGVAQETIASNAVGRVLVSGYAALVNVNAAVTRGHYGATHTVAKQAADAGTARATGTFAYFLTGGATPDAIIWRADAGSGIVGDGNAAHYLDGTLAFTTPPTGGGGTAATNAAALIYAYLNFR